MPKVWSNDYLFSILRQCFHDRPHCLCCVCLSAIHLDYICSKVQAFFLLSVGLISSEELYTDDSGRTIMWFSSMPLIDKIQLHQYDKDDKKDNSQNSGPKDNSFLIFCQCLVCTLERREQSLSYTEELSGWPQINPIIQDARHCWDLAKSTSDFS